MSQETFDLDQLARYLGRDAREVAKLVNRGGVPGRKVGGNWRFARQEINHWLETQMGSYSDLELQSLETPAESHEPQEPLITSLLHEACVAVPLAAGTRASVLKELVVLAEQSWQVFDPDAILNAVRVREDTASTALENGVAIPHPHRPIPGSLGESVIAFGRTAGLPFGAPDRKLTDLFFLVLCQDDRTHLKVLARLARLFLRPSFLDQLRNAECGHAARQIISEAEADLLRT